MSNALVDSIARVARHEAAAVATASIGVVASVNTTAGFGADHSVGVELRDRGIVLPSVPIAVGALGFVATPAVGDVVLIVFADGDLHAPIVAGRLYHGGLAPPDHGADQLMIALPPGSLSPSVTVAVDSSQPSVEVAIGATTAVINSSSVELKTGTAVVSIDASGAAAVTLDTGASSVRLSGNGDASIEATGTLKLKGTIVEIQADAVLEMQGSVVQVN